MQRSHVIVVGNEKGGSGKSTTAMHLIVCLLRLGRTVASIDLDIRQGTLSRYIDNRSEFARQRNMPLPIPEHYQFTPEEAEADRLAEIYEWAKRVFDFIVIDTPGHDTPLSQLGHSLADTLITPLNDSFVDLDVLARVDGQNMQIIRPSHYAEMIWQQKKQKAAANGGSIDWIVMRNRLSHLDARSKRQMERLLGELSKRIGFRTVPGFGERVVYRELFPKGLTMMDMREVEDGSSLNLSHITARQEVRTLVEAVRMDGVRQNSDATLQPVNGEVG
ncbi:MAG: AAA family ATPase [Rhodospirillales bacterium]|nr:AAA family ATPase [Rhodospirillales bacterium]